MNLIVPHGSTWIDGYLLRWNTNYSRIKIEVFAPRSGDLIYRRDSDVCHRNAALRCAYAAISEHLVQVYRVDERFF